MDRARRQSGSSKPTPIRFLAGCHSGPAGQTFNPRHQARVFSGLRPTPATRPQKRRRRPLRSQGRRDTMVVRQFVHRASALRPSALIRGAPVRRHPAKAEPRALWCAGHRTLGASPLSCHRAAEATLFSGHPLSRARAVLDPALGVPQALQATRHFRCSFCSPLLQRLSNQAFPWGHPVARPATVSSLNATKMTENPVA